MQTTLRALCLLATLCILGCDGGGGDEDTILSQDSCAVLGLKIINGAQCSTSGSSVVWYEVFYSRGNTTLCSGTVISPTEIITAAHCFPQENSVIERVVAHVNGGSIPAEAVVLHPEYQIDQQSQKLFNDVAIISLSSKANVPALPIIVSQGVEKGSIIDIFGFGVDQIGDAGALRSGQMEIDDVDAFHLTSIYDGENGSNTCQGDSGGPAIMTIGNNQQVGLVGVTSTGSAEANCLKGDVSRFTNLQSESIIDFILQVAPTVTLL